MKQQSKWWKHLQTAHEPTEQDHFTFNKVSGPFAHFGRKMANWLYDYDMCFVHSIVRAWCTTITRFSIRHQLDIKLLHFMFGQSIIRSGIDIGLCFLQFGWRVSFTHCRQLQTPFRIVCMYNLRALEYHHCHKAA